MRVRSASERILPCDEASLDRQLLDGPLDRLSGDVVVRVRQLEEDPPGSHHGHPSLRVALARTHAGLGRLLGDGLVGEDVDPHLPAALDVAGHRDTGGLDLAGGDPTGLQGLDPVLTERDGCGALRHAARPAAVLLAVLHFSRHQHGCGLNPRRRGTWASRGAGEGYGRSPPPRRGGARAPDRLPSPAAWPPPPRRPPPAGDGPRPTTTRPCAVDRRSHPRPSPPRG